MWMAIHVLHILAFLGCLTASGLKLRRLARPTLDGAAFQGLRRLDVLSSSSTGVIMLTGTAMLVGQPGRLAHLQEPAFLLKLLLFVIASGLVIATKIFLRRTPDPAPGASLPTPPWARWALLVDFCSIAVIAATGVAIAHGGL